MQRTKIRIVAACGLILSISTALTLQAQVRVKPRRARINPVSPEFKGGGPPRIVNHARARAAFVDPGNLTFSVTIAPSLSLTPAEQTLYEDMATELGDFSATPQNRWDFFSGVDGYSLYGWGGVITDVTPITGGYRVTATVIPYVRTDDDEEAEAFVVADYSERFDVVNGTVTYVDSLDPLGQAGQVLGSLEF